MNQDQDKRSENLDEEMERDTEIRRETQVRGSMGVPPSGEKSDAAHDGNENIPEFDRGSDEDRDANRQSER